VRGKRSRLVPFAFNTEQTYVLEFGDLKMRVVKDGGYVLEAGIAITGITQGNPGVVTTSGAHGWSTGDRIFLDGVGGMVELDGRSVDITVLGASSFAIGIDTSGYAAWTSGGTAARHYTLATPYPEADLPRLKFVQSADTMTLTHPSPCAAQPDPHRPCLMVAHDDHLCPDAAATDGAGRPRRPERASTMS
jgi:hypothetical protein